MKTEPKSVWIIGPSCAGKTAVAKLLVDRLKESRRACVLLDGPEVRALFDNKLGYDPASRRKQTMRIRRLAKLLSSQGVTTVIAMIHPFEDDRRKCRDDIAGYFEVFLKCDTKTLIERDSKKIYLPAIRGEKKNVVGVDIPFDEPETPDLVVDSDRMSPTEILEVIWRRVQS